MQPHELVRDLAAAPQTALHPPDCRERDRPFGNYRLVGSAPATESAPSVRQDLARSEKHLVTTLHRVLARYTLHPRITLHFTPTSGSWLNMVGIFFGIITR